MDLMNQGGCSLGSGEMQERVEAWRDISLRAISREVHSEEIRSIYPSEPGLIRRLHELIAAEAACCSFLRFTLEVGTTQTSVVLRFPPEARGLVERVISVPEGPKAR